MNIHILGICGTFMAGIAVIARSLGHNVTGSDENIYPPMSTLLEQENIDIIQGYDPVQLKNKPDLVIIGNAMSRGNPCVEFILNHNLNYISAPQWLHDNVLKDRWVIAVSGTHGKTTVTGMVNWILEQNNAKQGYLVGGIPGNFEHSARLGESQFFVIEADEYDSAFFDKRSKFVHYCPRTLILNNLEFDHADIFDDLNAIKKQFNHLIRLVPSEGLIIAPHNDENIKDVLTKGCWSQTTFINDEQHWQVKALNSEASQFDVYFNHKKMGEVKYDLVGEHNMHNALMAIVAAHHTGITIGNACAALSSFKNAKRRLELYAHVGNVDIYDDFAHHPTAFLATLNALRSKVGEQRRILAVVEPRSNTMKLGIAKNEIAPSLKQADEIHFYQPDNLTWRVSDIAKQCHQPTFCYDSIDDLIHKLTEQIQENDVILIMSNGGFGGVHKKITEALTQKMK